MPDFGYFYPCLINACRKPVSDTSRQNIFFRGCPKTLRCEHDTFARVLRFVVMNNKPTPSPEKNVTDNAVATLAEVEAAIELLTAAEWLKLNEFAKWRIRGLGRKARGRSAPGLLQEAFASTLEEGGRHWPTSKVDFVGFLCRAMQSISSNWGAKFDRNERQQADSDGSELHEVSLQQLNEDTLPLTIHTSFPDPERALLAKEEVEIIERMVESRETAALIVEALKEEKSGPEIQECFGITRTEYETEMKWIRRNAKKTLPEKV